MIENTYLSEVLEGNDCKDRLDTEVKKVLSDKTVLAWILKHTTGEFEPYPIETIKECIEGTPEVSVHRMFSQSEKIEGMDTTSKIPREGEFSFDIRFKAMTPQSQKVRILLNIELQKSYYPGYHFCSRGVFYCARMLSEQAYVEFTPDDYDSIKKVYSIWLCMQPPMKYANTITEYSMGETNIYGEFTGEENYDLLSVLVIRLCTDNNVECENQLINMLNVLLSTKLKAEQKKELLETEYQMKMLADEKGDFDHMCNLSDLIVEETEKIVTAGETVKSVTNLMNNLQLSLEKACEALGKTVGEFQVAQSILKATTR